MEIESITQAIEAQQVRVTDHADEEMVADEVSLDDVFCAVRGGEVIEDYPSDRPLPNCLIDGQTKDGQHVHSV
jgi:hypothetical protein